jgi:hypothetical protein
VSLERTERDGRDGREGKEVKRGRKRMAATTSQPKADGEGS